MESCTAAGSPRWNCARYGRSYGPYCGAILHQNSTVAPIVMEGFAILLVAALLFAAKWDLRPAALKANLRSGTGLAAIALVGIALLSCLSSRDRAISLQGALQLGIGVMLYFI